MSETKDAILERLWLVGSVLAVLSLILPYASISGQVAGRQLFQNVPVGLLQLLDFVSSGPPDPVVGLLYLVLPPVLVGVASFTLLGVIVSLRSRYWGGYLLLSAWLGFWIAAVFAINTVSIPGVSQLNVSFSGGFYALLIGSLLVFSHHVRSHEATQTRHERLSLLGGSLVYGSLLLPYLQLSGTLFGLTITVGFTLPGLAITLPGANLVAMAVVMGVFLIAGWLAMPPGVIYPGDFRLKSDIYPLGSAVLVFVGLGTLVGATETLLGSLGVSISYQMGTFVAATGALVLVGATVDQRRVGDERESPTAGEDEAETDESEASTVDEQDAGEIGPAPGEMDQPAADVGQDSSVSAEVEAATGHDQPTGAAAGLEGPAERLDLPPEPDPITGGIETMQSAIDAVVDEADSDRVGTVDGQSDPIERATAVERAADGGTLFESATDSDDADRGDGTTQAVPPALTDAVETASMQATPQTGEGQELMDALRLADEVSERHLTETLDAVIEKLNNQAVVAFALAQVDEDVGPRAIARQLDRASSRIDNHAGRGLANIADELDDAIRELEACRSQREKLTEKAESVCTAANDQTTVTFDSNADTDQWLAALAEYVGDETILFTDQATDIGTIVSNVEGEVRPESRLSRSVVDVLRGNSRNADDREKTIADAIEAIDSTETLRHRVEGVTPEDVERLADLLKDDLARLNTAGSGQLADRVEELRKTAAQAGESDLVTVYAARQELRFYDDQLIDALQQPRGRSKSDSTVADRYEEIEQRRTRMRNEYPSTYPNHDHSIPIHFLELVENLQASADEARTSGNEQRALGYLEAADRALDWVAELYDRHAYNVLLEQLRG